MSSGSRPQPVPSWPTVIATTLWLWLKRHVIPQRPSGPRPLGNYRRLVAIRADTWARKLAGIELAANKNISMRAPARAALAAGRVGSRLLVTLGALTHQVTEHALNPCSEWDTT